MNRTFPFRFVKVQGLFSLFVQRFGPKVGRWVGASKMKGFFPYSEHIPLSIDTSDINNMTWTYQVWSTWNEAKFGELTKNPVCQDEEMEIRRMHELVEQTTQVLQQVGAPTTAETMDVSWGLLAEIHIERWTFKKISFFFQISRKPSSRIQDPHLQLSWCQGKERTHCIESTSEVWKLC